MARSDFSKAPPVAQSCPQCGGEMRVARREPAPGNPAMERLVARMREMRQHRREDAGEEESLAWRSGRKPAFGRCFAAAHNSGDGLRDILTDLHQARPCEAAGGEWNAVRAGQRARDIKNKVGWGDARDTQILAGIRRGCGHRAAGRVAPHKRRTTRTVRSACHHHHQRRRPERPLHARARRGAAASAWAQTARSSRTVPAARMNLGTRACSECAARRLHDLHHQRGCRWSTINGCSRACRSIRKPRCSRSSMLYHLIHILVVNSELKREERSTIWSRCRSRSPARSTTSRPARRWSSTWRRCGRSAAPTGCGCRSAAAATRSTRSSSGTTPIALVRRRQRHRAHPKPARMTPLVMMNNVRSPNFPNVPLLAETGYAGAPSRGWYGLFAPPGTPRPIVDRINKEVTRDRRQAGVHRQASHRAQPGAGAQLAGGVRRRHRARPRAGQAGGVGRRDDAAVAATLSHKRACRSALVARRTP